MTCRCILLLLPFLVGISLHGANAGHESHGCEAGFGASPDLSQPSDQLLRQSTGTVPKPAVVSRTAWGCPDGQSSRWTPQKTTVTHLIVHHSAGSNSSANWRNTVLGIWNYHALDRGWGDIGYNYLIDPNGVIYEGRAGGENVVGAHFSCRNGGTFGVCLLGDFTSRSPTTAALSSLKKLLAWKADQLNIDPEGIARHSGTGLDLYRISGHRNGNDAYPDNSCTTTSCPGNFLYNLLPQVREDVRRLIDPPLPTVRTLAATNITAESATLRGSVTDSGDSAVVERRFEWARASLPWGAGTPGIDSGVVYHSAISGPNNDFAALLGNLEPCTSYRYRVYARNGEGWSDDAAVNVATFTTSPSEVALRFELLQMQGSEVQMHLAGPCGAPFVLEQSTDLEEWTEVQSGHIPVGSSLLITADSDANGAPAFFRARLRD